MKAQGKQFIVFLGLFVFILIGRSRQRDEAKRNRAEHGEKKLGHGVFAVVLK